MAALLLRAVSQYCQSVLSKISGMWCTKPSIKITSQHLFFSLKTKPRPALTTRPFVGSHRCSGAF